MVASFEWLYCLYIGIVEILTDWIHKSLSITSAKGIEKYQIRMKRVRTSDRWASFDALNDARTLARSSDV
ncbi:hypothetical protein CPB84DRAFT_1783302, partial [Gymnopilus junonius]